MKKNNILKSFSGFSMVEVMVAMALMGAVSLGVMKIMENSNKASKAIEVKDDIIQFERLISDVLQTQNNCEVTLGEKTVDSTIPVIYQVVNGQPTPKFSVSSGTSRNIQITSMKVKAVDLNGSDGSSALASLEVRFKKPSGVLGGSEVVKEIMLNANLCQKKWIKHADINQLTNLCQGKIVEGPTKWGTIYWAACQDCSMANSKTIYSCQARGGSGVDVGNMTKITCYNMGGTFDDVTSTCNLKDKITQDSCYALGGQINQNGECKFNNNQFTLAEFIQDFIKKEVPECVVLPVCTGKYSNSVQSFIVQVETQASYNEYTRKCTSNYKRYWRTGGWLNLPDPKSVLCNANYSAYGTTTRECTTSPSRDANVTCYNPDWVLSCSGCGSGCFEKTSTSCTTISTVPKTEPATTNGRLYRCCRM